ncbi:MAG: outer membrane protein assembly factor BamB family protein [Planctomycetota bacterium]|jgi:outer membrane protein assembly factor BamB
MIESRRSLGMALATLLALGPAAWAGAVEQPGDAHWAHWRGPHANGTARGDAPLSWSDTENIKWQIDVPGRGYSTPVVWGDRMFLTTAVPVEETGRADELGEEFHGGGGRHRKQSFEVVCLDRHSGEVIWRRTATETQPHEGYHAMYGSFASISPVTDGTRLYVSFGSFGLYAYDLDGNLLWQRDAGVRMEMRRQFGEGSTPAVRGDTLVHVFDHEGESFIIALDAATGTERWRVGREEPSTWATPLVTEFEDRAQVIASGTNAVRSYDLETGELIWECGGLGLNVIPSPLRFRDTVLVMSGYRDRNIMAIRLGGSGDITGTDHVEWNSSRGPAYTCQPVLADGKLYVVTDRGQMSCFDAVTGEAHYLEQRLPRGTQMKASPVLADGRLYLPTESGDVHVVSAGTELQVLTTNHLTDQFFVASPVIVDGEIYLRSRERLYCISDGEEPSAIRH